MPTVEDSSRPLIAHLPQYWCGLRHASHHGNSGELGSTFSRFRPLVPGSTHTIRMRYPPGRMASTSASRGVSTRATAVRPRLRGSTGLPLSAAVIAGTTRSERRVRSARPQPRRASSTWSRSTQSAALISPPPPASLSTICGPRQVESFRWRGDGRHHPISPDQPPYSFCASRRYKVVLADSLKQTQSRRRRRR